MIKYLLVLILVVSSSICSAKNSMVDSMNRIGVLPTIYDLNLPVSFYKAFDVPMAGNE